MLLSMRLQRVGHDWGLNNNIQYEDELGTLHVISFQPH